MSGNTTSRWTLASCAIGLGMLVAAADASTYYWDTNSATAGIGSATSPVVWLTNSWTTSSTGTAATGAWPNTQPVNSDEAVFMGTAGTVNIGGDVYANALRFLTNAYTIGSTGGTLHLAGTSPTITVNLTSSGTVTISAPILGDNGFTLAGNSTSSAIRFLQLDNADGSNPNAFAGTLTINNGGALRLRGGMANEQIPDNVDLVVSGIIDFNTSMNASDGKQEKVRNVTVSGANANFSVGNEADFVVNSITATSTSGPAIALNGNNAAAPNIPGKLSITGWSDGAADLVLQDGRVRLNTTGATSAVGSRVLLSRNITSSGTSSVTNVNGPSATVNTNNFTNKAFDFTSAAHTIDVTDGTLTFTSASANHMLQVTSTNPGGTTLTKTGPGTWLWEHAVESSFTGTNRVAAGTWRIGTSERLADAAALEVTGGTFDLQSFTETVGAAKLSSGTITGTVAAMLISAADFQVESGLAEAKLSGSVGLVKSTSGTATLAAANNYTGATTINQGTLLVNGAPTGGGSYTVGPGGMLGGTGTIDAPILVDGTLAPGESIGVFTVTDDVTFRAASRFAVQLDGATADKLVVEDLDLGANQFLDVAVLNATTGSSWLVAQYSGVLTDTFDTVTAGYTVDYGTPGQILLRLAGLAGDYNSNGFVDAADYVVWRENIGAATLNNRDPNGMGVVGQADYDFWRTHFGEAAGAGAAATAAATAPVPEPTSSVMLILGMLAPFTFRRMSVQ